MLKKFVVALVMAFALPGMTTVATFTFVPEAQAFSFKKAVKKVGRSAKKAGKFVRHVAKVDGRFYRDKVGKPIGRFAKKAGRKAGKGACFAVGGCSGTIGDPIGPKIRDHRR